MKTVSARFTGTSATNYSYLVPEGDEPKVGDLLVTSIIFALRYVSPDMPEMAMVEKINVATVVAVDLTPSPKANKFYAQLISLSTLAERREANAQALEKVKRQRVIKAKLEAMLAEQSARDRFATLATNNPEAAALLAELEG